MNVEEVLALLDLAPHPEGGYYRQTWADGSGSAIYYLLPGTEWAAWHRVRDRVEIWHCYAGAQLELQIAKETVVLGTDLSAGHRPQAIVPADTWQRARSLGTWTLVGCTVTPPFTFDAFELSDGQVPP